MKLYSPFELILPQLSGQFDELNLKQYKLVFEHILNDYSKETDLVKKLTYNTMYNEKIKVGYDE